MPFVPAEHHGKPVLMALMVYAGNAEAGERAVAPFRALATPLADMVKPIRYPEMYEGPEGPRPPRCRHQHARRRPRRRRRRGDPRAPRELDRDDGGSAAARARRGDGAAPDNATAFATAAKMMIVNVAAMYGNPAEAGARRLGERPDERTLDGTAAAYIGFLGDDGEEGVRRAYPPATLERLAEVKRQYDPDNLFRLNLNVPPAKQ